MRRMMRRIWIIGLLLAVVPAFSVAAYAPLPDHKEMLGPWFQIACTPAARHADNLFNWPPGVVRTHEHQYFGSVAFVAGRSIADAEARAREEPTTCSDRLDTAGYWVPTLYDEHGRLHTPHRIRVYYAAHANDRAALRAFPPGLRMTAGDPWATTPQPEGVVAWQCRARSDQNAGRPLWRTYPPTCRPDEYLSVAIRFPDCWNGRDLTSADGKSHVAYADARGRCPSAFPVKLPKIRYSVTYDAGGGYTGGNFTLGGPRGAPDAIAAAGMHGHFVNTWNQERLERYVTECLQKGNSVGSVACRR